MIITRAPMRVSLFGGGTDVPSICRSGAVFSMAIDKYVYVMLKNKFDGQVRISYSQTENVKHISDIQNALIRESLIHAGITRTPDDGLELITASDVPSNGSGMGASSSLVVAILAACALREGDTIQGACLAKKACEVEIERMGKPIGKQDQYAAALGGVCLHLFNGSVTSLPLQGDRLATWNKFVMPRMMLLYLGPRSSYTADQILSQGYPAMAERMAEQAREAYEMALHADPWELTEYIGLAMSHAWEYKKRLTPLATNPEIDAACSLAYKLGADGVKILGAGGGGCLLVYADPELHDNIQAGLGLRRIDFAVSPYGVTGGYQ